MQSWTVRFIVYRREDRYEVEGLNIGVAAVGTTVHDATDYFQKSCRSLAAFTYNDGSRLIFDHEDDEELELYNRLASGEVGASEVEKLGAIGSGSFKMTMDADSPDAWPSLHGERLNLIGAGAF